MYSKRRGDGPTLPLLSRPTIVFACFFYSLVLVLLDPSAMHSTQQSTLSANKAYIGLHVHLDYRMRPPPQVLYRVATTDEPQTLRSAITNFSRCCPLPQVHTASSWLAKGVWALCIGLGLGPLVLTTVVSVSLSPATTWSVTCRSFDTYILRVTCGGRKGKNTKRKKPKRKVCPLRSPLLGDGRKVINPFPSHDHHMDY